MPAPRNSLGVPAYYYAAARRGGFYGKPILRFTRLLETHLAVAPGGWRTFPTVMSNWFGEKLDLLKEIRSTLPAITHVDFPARIQTVERESNPLLYDLLLSLEQAAGCGALVNTSFKVRGESIVCTRVMPAVVL